MNQRPQGGEGASAGARRQEEHHGIPLRVCFFPGQLQLGGVGRITMNLVEELLGRGIEVDLFLSKKAGVYVSQIPEGARVFEGRGTVRQSILPLARYLRGERPDLLVASRPYINLAAVIAKRLARTDTVVVITEHRVITDHGRSEGQSGTDLYRKILPMLIRRGCRWLYPLADHVVAVSGAVAEDVSKNVGLDRARVRVIHNPVFSTRVDQLYDQPIRDEWIESSDAPIVLGVGRLTLQKDFFTLVRAFAQVRQEVPVRLVILGEGEDREDLEALARDLGVEADFYLPGYVENPFAYMRTANVFVLSSLWEGLPTVLIEALGSGTPVISTDCPGGSREILADGTYGRLVPPQSVKDLAHAIRATLREPREPEQLRERARDFTPARATDEYLALLRTGPRARTGRTLESSATS